MKRSWPFLALPFLAFAAEAGSGDCYSFEIVNNVKMISRDHLVNGRPGFTGRPYRLDIKTADKECGPFKEIVWTNGITIYLSSRLGACQRYEVLNHEKKHVASYVKAFQKIIPWADDYMRTRGRGAPDQQLYKDIYDRLLSLQQEITEENRQFDWRQYNDPKVTHYVIKACGSIWD